MNFQPVAPGLGKVAAINTPVGKKRSLFIGLNVVAALQRNECVGRSFMEECGGMAEGLRVVT